MTLLCSPTPGPFSLASALWAAALDPEGLGTQDISPYGWQVLRGQFRLGSVLHPYLPHRPHPRESAASGVESEDVRLLSWLTLGIRSVFWGGGKCNYREAAFGTHPALSAPTHSSA